MNIQKLFFPIFCICLMAIVGCQEDALTNTIYRIDENGKAVMQLTISVPASQTVVTRGGTVDENTVENLSVLVFSSKEDGAVLEQKQQFSETELEDVTPEGGTVCKRFTVRLTPAEGSKAVYVVANVNPRLESFTADGKTTLADVRKLVTSMATDIPTGEKAPFAMSACIETTVPGIALVEKTIPLIRSVAKFTLQIEEGVNPKFSEPLIRVWYAQTSGSILTGADVTDNQTPPALTSMPGRAIAASEGGVPLYVYPSQGWNDGSTIRRPCVIVAAKYNGESCYYRVNLVDETGKELLIRPNHHYELIVTDVKSPGYATEQEALENSPSGIAVTILDHEPQVFDMVTDGTYELGVSDTIHMASKATEAVTGALHVRCYPSSASSGEVRLNVVEGNDWLSASNTVSSSGNSDKDGMLYTYTLTAAANPTGLSRVGKVEVTYHSLKRIVTVVQVDEFLSFELGTIQLAVEEYERDDAGAITSTTNIPVSNDYWKFIRNELRDSPLFGISADAMNGLIRTEGFHAPMTDYMRFIYTYKLETTNEVVSKYTGWKWEVELADDYKGKLRFWSGSTSNTEGGSLDNLPNGIIGGSSDTFTFTNELLDIVKNEQIVENAYRVGKDAFRIKLTSPDGSQTVTYAYDLYHTGVFQYMGSSNVGSHVVGNALKPGWYYYEVVLMGNNYWLDRNLGAKSSGYYIEEEDGSSFLSGGGWPFLDDSKGALFSVATEPSYVNGTYVPSVSDEMCPKGFRVPYVSEFAALQADKDFHTELVNQVGKDYWDAYFDNGQYGMVRFPRARMYSDGVKKGDARAGYYWTRTPALGASGTEEGYWLQFMKFAGANLSAGRYRIKNSSNAPAGMSLRCVYKSRAREQTYKVEFYVQGYTHVFLYYLPQGGSTVDDLVPLNPWPGTMLTIKNDASSDTPTWKPFILEYTGQQEYELSKLRAVFAIVSDDGSIKEVFPSDYSTKGGVYLDASKKYFSRLNKESGWTATK